MGNTTSNTMANAESAQNKVVAVTGAAAVVAEIAPSIHKSVAAALDVNVLQAADILKLDIDCFDEVFEYLPLRDLIAISKTCKRLQAVAGYIFRQNYSDTRGLCSLDGIGVCVSSSSMNVNHLAPYICKISICSCLQSLFEMQSKLRRLKQIEIQCIDITHDDVYCMQDMLAKVEELCISACKLNAHFGELIDRCGNLKRLKIGFCEAHSVWFDRIYPKTLEHLQILPRETELLEGEMPKMLELNPSVKKFATAAKCLWANRDALKISNTKLDDLAILFYENSRNTWIRSFCVLLNELFERGFYKRLQLYFWEISNQKMIDQMDTVNGIVKLFFYNVKINVALPALSDLQEICLYKKSSTIDLDNTNLDNLRRIHFVSANLDNLVPLIKRAGGLEKIKIVFLEDGIYFNKNTNVIDLPALNRQREQLPFAFKITLYVREAVYLATKWALKETDFGLIRLKRCKSFEWDHDFGFK